MNKGIIWLKAMFTAVLIFAGFFILGAGLQVGLSQYLLHGGLKQYSYQPPAQTALYTADNEVLMQFGYERLQLDSYPELIRKSVVAMEDRRFYSHGGIDPQGMLRALWVDIKIGKKAQGASTITQQLARTLFLTNEKTMMRKTREIVIATALEKKYSKDEILTMYLNEIYMGRGVSGVGAAARKYFDKRVDELNVSEIAYLIAMIASPEHFSPDHDFAALKKRQETVLEVMEKDNLITAEQTAAAKNEPVTIIDKNDREVTLYPGSGSKTVRFTKDVGRRMQHPYITVYILNYLKSEYGEDAVYRGGLKVYTTVNERMQGAAEQAIDKQSWKAVANANDAALVSVEPGTGAVRAMVGGTDFNTNQINMAVAPRQPGSAIKPMIYAGALDSSLIDDNTVLNNIPRNFGGGYTPRNDSKNPPDQVTARMALVRSENVASVEVLNLLGVRNARRYLEQFGVTTLTDQDNNLAMGLGGLTRGISPLEMAAAYAALDDQGIWAEPYTIERIEEANGTILFEHSLNSRQVISSDASRMITSMLRSVVSYGTGTNAQIYIPSAGKTGTTSGRRDLWFVGYTSRLSTAVWVGNSNNKSTGAGVAYGGRACAPVWRNYYNQLLAEGILETTPSDESQQEAPPQENVTAPTPTEQTPAETPNNPVETPTQPPTTEVPPGNTGEQTPPGETTPSPQSSPSDTIDYPSVVNQ
ncbi:MAG: PBP1A family penicillin-binding protein [Methylocystaceae bacterium]